MSWQGAERNTPLRAVVAGLGRVGSSDDVNRPTPPRTHIGNLLANPAFLISALVEPNAAARHAAIRQWPEISPDIFVDNLAAVSPDSVDLAVVATPTPTRVADVRAVLTLNPKMLLLEKPLASNRAAGEQLQALLGRRESNTRVGYMRRFAPSIQAALNKFDDAPVKAVLRYTGGVLNSASHFIDLLVGRFGPVAVAQVLAAKGPIDDQSDPPIDFRLGFERGFDLYGLCLSGVPYGQLDCELYYPSGKVELAGNGVDIRVLHPRSGYRFAGYTHLAPDADGGNTDFDLGMSGMYEALARHARSGEPLGGCTVTQALHYLSIIDALRQSAYRGGSVVFCG